MRNLGLTGYALAMGAASALLAGCGGSQPPIGGSGAMAQTMTLRARHASGSEGDLLYVGSFVNGIYVLTYPQGQLVSSFQLSSGEHVTGLCSDNEGNVFAAVGTPDGQGVIVEYAHGGTTPIASLQDEYEPISCAVDPVTGDLAATSLKNVAIYPGAQGEATYYSDPDMDWFFYCAYDDSGNLFVDGFEDGNPIKLAELPYGGSSFADVTLNKNLRRPGSLQWMGSYLAMSAKTGVYRVSISGSTGTITGKTHFNEMVSPWEIYGNTLVGLRALAKQSHEVAYWKYPKGGNPAKRFNIFGRHSELVGVTISVAP
jgi:hypothetical protein